MYGRGLPMMTSSPCLREWFSEHCHYSVHIQDCLWCYYQAASSLFSVRLFPNFRRVERDSLTSVQSPTAWTCQVSLLCRNILFSILQRESFTFRLYLQVFHRPLGGMMLLGYFRSKYLPLSQFIWDFMGSD